MCLKLFYRHYISTPRAHAQLGVISAHSVACVENDVWLELQEAGDSAWGVEVMFGCRHGVWR